MILTQLRIAIAFTLVTALAGLSGEPDRPHFVEQGILPAAVEERLGTFRNSSVWLEEMSQPVRSRDLILEPSASCGATACHGGPRPGIAEDLAVRGAEYPLWLENDPHAQSWRTLCNEQSIAMLERLSIMRDGMIVNPKAFENCLACHNSTGGYAPASDSSKSVFHEEGVGCASCHGPSQNWRSDHYRLQRDNKLNASLGLVPNKDLFIRARVCASCHVGDSDRI
jgi:Cytochrome c554 and c-prime